MDKERPQDLMTRGRSSARRFSPARRHPMCSSSIVIKEHHHFFTPAISVSENRPASTWYQRYKSALKFTHVLYNLSPAELYEQAIKFRERDRDARRRKEEVAEPEADPERDQRTVFAYQICLKADERDVYEFFSRAGKVRDVRLIMDRNTRRSKGVGYIEFYDAMSVPMAIALSGQLLFGTPVMVKPSEAEKNLVQSNTTGGSGGLVGPYSGGARRLYVGNLHFNMTESQLRQVFEPFGTVELVQLPHDPETGLCKGFGFVQFARLEDARAAQSLNGQLEIAGKTIKVSAVTEQGGMQDLGDNAYRVELPDDVFISDVFNIRHLTPYAGENSSLRSSFSEEGESDEDIKSDQSLGQQVTVPDNLRRSKRLQNKRAWNSMFGSIKENPVSHCVGLGPKLDSHMETDS